MNRDALVIKEQDNVATAIRDIAAGAVARVGRGDEVFELAVADGIAMGHKVAVRDIAHGEDILKYGAVIGRATAAIPAGRHVHVHNVESLRGRGDLA